MIQKICTSSSKSSNTSSWKKINTGVCDSYHSERGPADQLHCQHSTDLQVAVLICVLTTISLLSASSCVFLLHRSVFVIFFANLPIYTSVRSPLMSDVCELYNPGMLSHLWHWLTFCSFNPKSSMLLSTSNSPICMLWGIFGWTRQWHRWVIVLRSPVRADMLTLQLAAPLVHTLMMFCLPACCLDIDTPMTNCLYLKKCSALPACTSGRTINRSTTCYIHFFSKYFFH